ncbi:MAG: hypothetical protein ACM31C_33615, partial [Acidobacteriota bacterium]
MKPHGRLAAAAVMLAACGSSKPHQTTGKFEDCYYDCKPGAKTADPGPTATPAAAAAAPAAKTPVGEKAASLREAADLLDKAQAKLDKGEKSVAEHYFATAELIVGPEL